MGQMTEVINNGQRIMWWKNHMIRVHTFLELKVWTVFGLNLPFGYTRQHVSLKSHRYLQMFNLPTDDLAVKTYIPHKSLLNWICCIKSKKINLHPQENKWGSFYFWISKNSSECKLYNHTQSMHSNTIAQSECILEPSLQGLISSLIKS